MNMAGEEIMGRYDLLSSRGGFNNALRHFNLVCEYAEKVADGYNLADLVNADMANCTIKQDQIMSVVNTLLHDKFQYQYIGFNFDVSVVSAEKVCNALGKWNALQLVLVYYDPVRGVVISNPVNISSFKSVLPFNKNEYALLYGYSFVIKNKDLLQRAINDAMRVITGKQVNVQKAYLRGVRKSYDLPKLESQQEYSESTADLTVSAPIPSTGNYRITPKYSVLVTNELFHNGNVEAWKKIITSYTNKFPNNQVLIWYESERINDINTLFKWGKVKNGAPILVSVAGTQISSVSKLQRYLFEGASPRFESFLRGACNQVLDLF